MMAPDFSLPDQDSTIHSLKDYRGKWLIVYFYPRDNTPGCTKEACNFRDQTENFKKKNIAIVGISRDSVKSHKNFAEKFHLTFPLLSDESKTTIQAFGAWGTKKFMGREFQGIFRNTYLINPNGEIVKTYERVNPLKHAKEILEDLEAFLSQSN